MLQLVYRKDSPHDDLKLTLKEVGVETYQIAERVLLGWKNGTTE